MTAVTINAIIYVYQKILWGEAMTEQEAEIMDSRGYSVVKANSIIQKSRYKLSIAEQRTIAYICSMIKPIEEDLVPYLFGLKQQFTQYQLLDILAMKSVYSIRIYELLKSYAGLKKKVFELDDLKKKLMVENISSYNRFPDFRRKVLDVAINEINNLTALNVSYEPISKGRKVIKIEFHMNMKKASEYTIAMATAENMLETKI